MRRHQVAVLLLVAGSSGRAAAAGRVAPHAAPAPAVGAAHADKTVERLPPTLGCDRLTIAEGLPNSDVHAIAQDARGFVWLGTQDGLVRYDGNAMRVYRPVDNDPTSLSSSYVASLLLDDSGKLWAGTEHGVNLYDPETDKFARFAKGPMSSDGVTAIAKDRKHRVWFAMSGGGLNRYEPTTGAFTKFLTKPLDTAITALDADASGTLWLGTAGDGLIRWNPDTGASSIVRPTPADDRGVATTPITAVLVSASGKVWIGTDGNGLFALEPGTGKLTSYRTDADDPASLIDDHVSVLLEDRAHNLWVGTTNGLTRIDAAGHIVQFQHDRNDPSSLAFHGVESMFQDAGGVMWVGGFTVGVCKFNEFRMKFGYHHTGNLATSFHEDADGTLWAGTYNDGLYKLERAAQRQTIYHVLRSADGKAEPISLESGTWISALHRDRRGTLWISLKGRGIVGLDTRADTFRLYVPDPKNPNSLPVDAVFDIVEDDQGKLWLASWGAGLVRFDPQTEVFTSFPVDDTNGISSNHLYRIYPDPRERGTLWLGAAKGGVMRFKTSTGTATAFRNHPEDPTSLSSDDVTSMYRDAQGNVWLGTYGGGLDRLDPATGKVQRYTTSNSGLPNNVILSLLPDDDGKLWLGTNGSGLVHFDPKTGKFLIYDAADGVQDNEFDQGSFKRSASGELFFGGPGGFNAFYPRDIKRDPYVPPLAFTTFKLINQESTLERPIWTLPAINVSYADSFAVEFSALAFAVPRKNRYAYKLDGFDDKFIETDRPYAVYTKLAGGNYTLRVRGANRHGVWNEQQIALKVTVQPPFWRTWRAYGIYLALLAGLAYLLYRIQRQRVLNALRKGRLEVVERDLELTGAVQTGFLPDHNEIATPQLQVFGLYRPADACGGDWWWHEPLPGGRHVIMVGDVTGHGPGPAMVTAAVATAFRVLIENGHDDVRRALEMLNREVLRVARGKYHMTMAALELDEATGRWSFYSAGAPPILSLGADGKHRVHFCAGAPLGTESGFETGIVEGQLAPQDRILMYTDGIPEIALPNGNVFGMRRFAQLYERTRAMPLRDAAGTMLQHADHSRGNQPQIDDWTFTLIEWGPRA